MVGKKENANSGKYAGTFAYRLIKRLIALIIFGSVLCMGMLHAVQAPNALQQCGNSYPAGIDYCIPLDIYNGQATIADGTQIPDLAQ